MNSTYARVKTAPVTVSIKIIVSKSLISRGGSHTGDYHHRSRYPLPSIRGPLLPCPHQSSRVDTNQPWELVRTRLERP